MLGVALLSALFAIAPGHAGAVGWVTGGPLTPNDRVARDPLLVETSAGTRVLAWEQRGTGLNDPSSINVRVAPPGAGFGPIETIVDDSAGQASLSAGADGTVALVWDDISAGSQMIRIDRLAPGAATFVDGTPIAAGGIVNSDLKTAVAGGEIVVAYGVTGTQGMTEFTAIDAVRLATGTTTAQRVAGATSADIERASFNAGSAPVIDANPTIAALGSTVSVAWERDQNGASGAASSTTELRTAQYTAGGGSSQTFGPPTPQATVTTPGGRAAPIIPQLAAGAGHVIAVWRQADGGPLGVRDLTAANAPTNSIASGGVDSFQASLAGDGTLIVAWQRFDSPHDTNNVFASEMRPGQPASAAARITPVNASRVLAALVTGADGRALIITDRQDEDGSDASDEQVQASVRPAGGAFGALEEVSGPQDHSPVASNDSVAGAFGPHDEVLIAWGAVAQSTTLADQIFISSRDAAPPTITSLAVPPRTQAGSPATLTARATDTQSPVALAWDFGDGSSAIGTSVTHIYGVPGAYTVTVTARDSAGNVTTARRSVQVTGDLTPPHITGLKLTNRRFRIGNSATAEIARARRAPIGTAFHLRTDERSTLVIVFTRTVLRHHRRQTSSPGTLVRSGRGPGNVTVRFSGRLGSARLPGGSYTATVTAVDAAGNRSRRASVRFQVVSR